jgi:hypothetical protein
LRAANPRDPPEERFTFKPCAIISLPAPAISRLSLFLSKSRDHLHHRAGREQPLWISSLILIASGPSVPFSHSDSASCLSATPSFIQSPKSRPPPKVHSTTIGLPAQYLFCFPPMPPKASTLSSSTSSRTMAGPKISTDSKQASTKSMHKRSRTGQCFSPPCPSLAFAGAAFRGVQGSARLWRFDLCRQEARLVY